MWRFLRFAKDKSWSPLSECDITELVKVSSLVLPQWWDSRSAMSHTNFPSQQHKILLLNFWVLALGILRKGGRTQSFEGKVKTFCNFGNIHLGKTTATQSFFKTNIQRTLDFVGQGQYWLICAIKKGVLWIILLCNICFQGLLFT